MLIRLLATVLVLAPLSGCAPASVRALRQGDDALHAGGFERALARYEAAAKDAGAEGAGAIRARALGASGAALLLLGRAPQAEAAYAAALKDLKNGPAVERAGALSGLGYACALQGRADDAAAAYRRALEEYARAPEASSSEVAARWADLGQLELAQRRFEPAEQAYSRALALRERAGPPDASLAPLLEDYAAALDGAGKREDAEAARKRARALKGGK